VVSSIVGISFVRRPCLASRPSHKPEEEIMQELPRAVLNFAKRALP
jgi:hypothetical protein